MTDEKILAFLNMEGKQHIDKTIMKIAFWFDVSFSAFITIFGIVAELMFDSLFDLVFALFAVVSVGVLATWLILAENPIHEYTYAFVVFTLSFVKLIFGSIMLSEINNETISIWHIIILMFFIILAVQTSLKKQRALQDLKITTIENTKNNIEKRNKGVGLLVLPVSTTASIGFVLSKFLTWHFEIGIGFLLWALASIWLFFSIGFLYNVIIIKKYKVADIFKNKIGDNSLS